MPPIAWCIKRVSRTVSKHHIQAPQPENGKKRGKAHPLTCSLSIFTPCRVDCFYFLSFLLHSTWWKKFGFQEKNFFFSEQALECLCFLPDAWSWIVLNHKPQAFKLTRSLAQTWSTLSPHLSGNSVPKDAPSAGDLAASGSGEREESAASDLLLRQSATTAP